MSLKGTIGAIVLAVGLSGCAAKQEPVKPTSEKPYYISIERQDYTLNLELKGDSLIMMYQANPKRVEDFIRRQLGSAIGNILAGEYFDDIFKKIDEEAVKKKMKLLKKQIDYQKEDKEEFEL